MESLRWILIFAGVAILLLLWWSGRSRRHDANTAREPDPLLGSDPIDIDFGELDPDDLARPGAVSAAVGRASPRGGVSGEPGVARAETPGTSSARSGAPLAASASLESDAPLVQGVSSEHGLGGLSQRFEAFGERLASNRRRRVAEPAPEIEERAAPPVPSKIVTLHVVASAGEILPPEDLRALLERRGYHHGDMNIYHSMHHGETVFSIARMVKPGTFDPDDLASFETPGIALILQLPGPVAADRAFEVMLDEAFEIAGELGGSVLDGNRSTLGRQTEQHLRESIHEYMHRQKYVEPVA